MKQLNPTGQNLRWFINKFVTDEPEQLKIPINFFIKGTSVCLLSSVGT